MKAGGKRSAATAGVDQAAVGAKQVKKQTNSASQHAAAVQDDDAAVLAAVKNNNRPGVMPTEVCHHKNPVRRHGKAIPELCPMASK